MMRSLARWLPVATLLCWGGLLLYFQFSGRLPAFLHPSFRPYVALAGAVLLILGVLRIGGQEESDGCNQGCGCSSGGSPMTLGRFFTFFILLVPALVAAFSSSDSFGTHVIHNRGLTTTADSLHHSKEDPLPVPTDGKIHAEVSDLLRAPRIPKSRAEWEGKTVETIGQFLPEKTSPTPQRNRFKLVRMKMACCAADARPMGVLVEKDPLPAIRELSWVKVIGKIHFPPDQNQPTIEAESITPIPAPAEPMLY